MVKIKYKNCWTIINIITIQKSNDSFLGFFQEDLMLIFGSIWSFKVICHANVLWQSKISTQKTKIGKICPLDMTYGMIEFHLWRSCDDHCRWRYEIHWKISQLVKVSHTRIIENLSDLTLVTLVLFSMWTRKNFDHNFKTNTWVPFCTFKAFFQCIFF